MATTFDEIKDTVSYAGKQIATKAQETASVVRVRAKISSVESEIKNQYNAIGKKVYEDAQESDRIRFADYFAAIKDRFDQISELEKELAALDKSVVCPNCGAKVGKDDSFCPKCGTNIENIKQETIAAETVKEKSEAETGAETEEKPEECSADCQKDESGE